MLAFLIEMEGRFIVMVSRDGALSRSHHFSNGWIWWFDIQKLLRYFGYDVLL
jgi:hypothetical protein